ncbi:hypothetical protein KZP23_16755 [Echinicola marina]|nr:hypothetical protein [Echinicola marina]UCS92340.1 hypothetical protein KZP23_16755 [Echinicola marina]
MAKMITPAKAQQILRENGLVVSEEKAYQIIDFMYDTAEMLIKTLKT